MLTIELVVDVIKQKHGKDQINQINISTKNPERCEISFPLGSLRLCLGEHS